MGGEGDDGFAFKVVGVFLEEGEHHLWICAPPDGTTNENGVVPTQIHVTFILGEFAVSGLFLCQIDERRVSHAVVLVSDNLKLVGTDDFCDIVGYNLCVANLNVSYCIVVSCMREEYND